MHRKWWIRLFRKVPFSLNLMHLSSKFAQMLITILKLSSKLSVQDTKAPESALYGTVCAQGSGRHVTRRKQALLHTIWERFSSIFQRFVKTLKAVKFGENNIWIPAPTWKTSIFEFCCHQTLYLYIYIPPFNNKILSSIRGMWDVPP